MIAQQFGRAADASQTRLNDVQRAVATLQNGDWVGDGAVAFYAEMNSQVLPSLTRLVEALRLAQQKALQISREIKQAEDEAAALLRGDGAEFAEHGGKGKGLAQVVVPPVLPVPPVSPDTPVLPLPANDNTSPAINPPLPSPKKEPDAKGILAILLTLLAALAAATGLGGGGGGGDDKSKDKGNSNNGDDETLPEGAIRDGKTGEVVVPKVVTNPNTGEQSLVDPRTGKDWPIEVGMPPSTDTPKKMSGWFGSKNSNLHAGAKCPEDITDAELEWYKKVSERALDKYKNEDPSETGDYIQRERLEEIQKELERRHTPEQPKQPPTQA